MSDRRHHGHPTDVVTHAHAHAKLRLQHVSHGHVITSVIVFTPTHDPHHVCMLEVPHVRWPIQETDKPGTVNRVMCVHAVG